MRIQPVARGLDFEKVGSPCDRSQANSIAKGSTITWFRKVRVRLVGLPLAIALLFPALGQDLPISVARSSQDSLNLSEEEYAYAANSPAARVTAFLRIADNKILAAKRLQKSNPNASLTESLKGYYAAMQGASLGVSWGRELGEDMRRHNAAIAKIARRHAGILELLGSGANLQERQALLQMRDFLRAQTTTPRGRCQTATFSGCVDSKP
jgi:hypothetical protein